MEFEQKIKSKRDLWKQSLDESRAAPCPRDVVLKNGSHREGERENTPVK
jgi:hypothetical protein